MKNFQEDDIIEIAAEHLASKQFQILALGANQAGFRFHTNTKNWKAPDLVVFRKPFVGVFEAKVRASQLFTLKSERMSDHDVIVFLLNSKQAQLEVFRQVRNKLQLDIKLQSELQIIGGLIAGNALSPSLLVKKDPNIVYLHVDFAHRTVNILGELLK